MLFSSFPRVFIDVFSSFPRVFIDLYYMGGMSHHLESASQRSRIVKLYLPVRHRELPLVP
jgi:hypothetical protein